MFIDLWLNFLEANNDNPRSKVIKFIILWMLYNQWYNEKYIDIHGLYQDKAKSIELANNQHAKEIYVSIQDKILSSFKNIPSVHCSTGERDRLWKDSGLEKEILFNEQYCDLKQFLKLIYQIRCNFLHGNKEGNDVNIQLITWAYDSLYKFLKDLNIGLNL